MYLGFELEVRQDKQFEGVILDSPTILELQLVFFTGFGILYDERLIKNIIIRLIVDEDNPQLQP